MGSLLRELARGGVTAVTRRTIPVTTPAAATGVDLTSPNGQCWEVRSLVASLVADANAANRAVTLSLSDGNSTLWTLPPLVVQAANATVGYSWIAEYPTPIVTTIASTQAMPLPPTILLPGWKLTIGIASAQAGDRLSDIRAQVLETFFGDTEAELNRARDIARHAEAIGELIAGEVQGV